MSDELTTLAELKDAVRRFVAERDWGPFHSPKNLAMAVACEAAELMEHFLWCEPAESRALVAGGAAARPAVVEELADVLHAVLCLSVSAGVDLSEALRAKMSKNAAKYPAPARPAGPGAANEGAGP